MKRVEEGRRGLKRRRSMLWDEQIMGESPILLHKKLRLRKEMPGG